MSAEPIDLAVLRSFIGDDPGDVSASIALFVESAGRARVELVAAAAAGDSETAGATAHRFKSVARYLGAKVLATHCERIERFGHAGDIAAIRLELPSMETELGRVLAALGPVAASPPPASPAASPAARTR
jgi:two-component system sensor histidine kinase/response regulator